MRKRSVLVVLGTRPEAIKLAPIIRALEQHSFLQPVVCVTGQHRELLDQALAAFGIEPHYDLDVMRRGQTLDEIAARILLRLPSVLSLAAPDFVLVQGDTSTCFAAALASFYRQIPVGHVEAGLRTGEPGAPFPEEAHRSMVSRLAALHFAPTEGAKQNLLHEGIDAATIQVTGNTVIDALRMMPGDAPTPFVVAPATDQKRPALSDRLDAPATPVVLITGHRRENLGQPLQVAVKAISRLAREHRDWCFVYVLHRNPEARRPAISALGSLDNVYLVEPLDYVSFIRLLRRCNVVLTDSGGIQEEATELGKPILVMREVTDRPEGVERGAAMLVGTGSRRISRGVEEAVLAPVRPAADALYGDGQAASRIVNAVWSAVQSMPPRAKKPDRSERIREASAGAPGFASDGLAMLRRPTSTGAELLRDIP